MIMKPGRLSWQDDELFEIPNELKLPTCIQCGQVYEDPFLVARLQKALQSQKKMTPGPKLLSLRWIHRRIDSIFDRPEMWASDGQSLFEQIVTYLEFRELILYRGVIEDERCVLNFAVNFMQKKFKTGNPNFNSIELTKLVPIFRELCDVWINSETL